MSAVLSAASSAAEFAAAGELFQEYARALDIDLQFQNFAAELLSIPTIYAPPDGCLLLAARDGVYVGCGGVRRLRGKVCEMKRLYVKPSARGADLGRRLAAGLIGQAAALGYTRMVLDTLATMHAARELYRSLGFRETGAYYDNPLPDAIYLELDLVRPDLTASRSGPDAP